MTELAAKRHPTVRFMAPAELLAAAWVSAAEGAVSEARRTARTAAERARSYGLPAVEVVALQVCVQLGDASVAGRLRSLVSVVDGARAGIAADHAAALATTDGPALMAVCGRWLECGDLIASADAAALGGVAYGRRGVAGRASLAAARAHQLADQAGGLRTPALTQAVRPLPLTAREQEVLALVARGLTNRAIAERLDLSVRTVEGHVYRIAEKIGVSDRSELAALLPPPGGE